MAEWAGEAHPGIQAVVRLVQTQTYNSALISCLIDVAVSISVSLFFLGLRYFLRIVQLLLSGLFVSVGPNLYRVQPVCLSLLGNRCSDRHGRLAMSARLLVAIASTFFILL